MAIRASWRSPLGFVSAIERRLERLNCGWTYLLNSDMQLNDDTLERLLAHRAPDVFSLASSIRMRSNSSGRETNRTSIEFVEWGVLARQHGLRNLFIPDSQAEHAGRATVNRFYEAAEVARIFERNRMQFHLQCSVRGGWCRWRGHGRTIKKPDRRIGLFRINRATS